jgi:hypothetical protein
MSLAQVWPHGKAAVFADPVCKAGLLEAAAQGSSPLREETASWGGLAGRLAVGCDSVGGNPQLRSPLFAFLLQKFLFPTLEGGKFLLRCL